MIRLFGKGFSVPRPYGYNRHCIIMEYNLSYPNEFNILLTINNSNIVVIDFPQMISIEHKEAENYFKKDIKCVKKF